MLRCKEDQEKQFHKLSRQLMKVEQPELQNQQKKIKKKKQKKELILLHCCLQGRRRRKKKVHI